VAFWQRDSTRSYNDEGTDVGCNYLDEDRVFTLYLSRFGGDTISRYFEITHETVGGILVDRGYQYNEKLSDTCSNMTIDELS